MAKNFTKTLQGKSIDFEELMLRNEDTRAVGNMKVNARGEADNVSVQVNDTVASKTHKPGNRERRRHEKRVEDAPVMNSKKAAMAFVRQYAESQLKQIDEIPGLDTITKVEPEPVIEEAPPPAPKPKAVQPAPVKKPEPAPAPVFKEEPKEEVSEELLQKVINKSTGGLAGAIAKAKEVKQEPLKTPREEARNETGVKRI